MTSLQGALRKGTMLIAFLVMLLLTIMSASAQEDFTFSAQAADISVCLGEQRDVLLITQNTGNYYSQYMILHDDPKQTDWALVNTASCIRDKHNKAFFVSRYRQQ